MKEKHWILILHGILNPIWIIIVLGYFYGWIPAGCGLAVGFLCGISFSLSERYKQLSNDEIVEKFMKAMKKGNKDEPGI